MTTSAEIRTAVYHLLAEVLPSRAPVDNIANDETPTDEFMDSFDTFTFIQELESKFNIEVADHDVSSDNLGSVARIVQFVQNKLASH